MEIPAAGDTGILKMTVKGFTISNRVYVPERLKPDNIFEERYIHLREKEKRIYSDEELLQLPLVFPGHVHASEWQIRKRSAERLVQYFSRKEKPVRLLEIGCGNGWLCRQLATIPGSRVIGTDINFTELQQAARVFSDIPNLLFIYGQAESGILGNMEFDGIIFASCIQYFPSAKQTIKRSLQLLRPGGEVHILDSPFYKRREIPAAKDRTSAYYVSMGFSEMSRHYHHHALEDLDDLKPLLLYKPTALSQFLHGERNPFPWVCIKQSSITA